MFQRALLRVLLTFAVLLTAAQACPAQSFVEHVHPPAIYRGQTTRITLAGRDLRSATALWTSFPADKLHARLVPGGATDTVTFDVEVAADAPLGLYGLRLAMLDGLSNTHLFAVDDLPLVEEVEKPLEKNRNEKPQSAEAVSLPASIAGVCGESDVDTYAFDVQAGERLSFEVVGSRLGKAFDPVLTLLGPDGKFLAEQDNDTGLCFDCRFEHTFAKAGRHFVQIRDTRYHGSPYWGYLLRIGRYPVARTGLPSTVRPGERALLRFPFGGPETLELDVPTSLTAAGFFQSIRRSGDNGSAWIQLATSPFPAGGEVEPNDSPMQAGAAAMPGNLYGLIARPGDVDWFALDLPAGAPVAFRAHTRDIGSPADVELVLLDPAGKEVQRADDSGFDDATFSYSAATDGRHLLQVRELIGQGGAPYAYWIEVRQRQPAIQLISSATGVAVPRGSWQPIALAAERTDFSGPIELGLLGAPTGMTLSDSVIPAAAKGLTTRLQVDRSVPAGLYTVQIAARAGNGEGPLTTRAVTRPLVDRLPDGHGPHGEDFELREDQRRLPPSLTDCIAVAVIPESHFDFEISTTQVVLPRFVQAEFQIQSTFAPGTIEPATFTARGGTLDRMQLRAPAIKAEIPAATALKPAVSGLLRSYVLTNLAKHDVFVTGTSEFQGRRISLTRVFELEILPAFRPEPQPARIELEPGGNARVTIAANRVAPFGGALDVTPTAPQELLLPPYVSIAEQEQSVVLDIKAVPEMKPGTYQVSLRGTARIGTLTEDVEGTKIEVVVNPPAAPKK